MDLSLVTEREAELPRLPNKIHAITGMRRSGKTCFLFQCLRERLEAGAPRESLVYFNFEDERLGDFSMADLNTIPEEFYRQFPDFRSKQRVCFCFDKIQVVPDWERFVRRLLDEENVEILISGSSAKMLSREVATSMRGRAMETVITPFSFGEFLRHRAIEGPQHGNLISGRTRSRLVAAFDEYMAVGGFPEVAGAATERDRIQLLQQYIDAVLFRDVVERHAVSNLPALRALVRTLLKNPACLFSISKIHKDFQSQGIKVSKESLLEYLAHLEDAFLVQPLPIFAQSERRRNSNPRKTYLADHSLNLAVSPKSGQNHGHHLENVVACELRRRCRDLAYFRTESGHEVDFLVHDFEGGEQLVQVSETVADLPTLQREIRALEEASSERPEAKLLLLTWNDPERVETLDEGGKVEVRAVWRWLLGV